MARIISKIKTNFHPGVTYNEKIEILPGANTLDEKHLEHWYIKELIEKKLIEIAEEAKESEKTGEETGMEGMTVRQLTDIIKGLMPDFDFRGKKKADLLDALTAYKPPTPEAGAREATAAEQASAEAP